MQRREGELTDEDRREHNLFLFGEPETSPTVARLFSDNRITVGDRHLTLQGRTIPRVRHGLWIALPSPFAAHRTVVVNCGIPWGASLSDNHRYDLLPDLLVYREETGRLGLNRPAAAAEVGDDGRFRWFDLPAEF